MAPVESMKSFNPLEMMEVYNEVTTMLKEHVSYRSFMKKNIIDHEYSAEPFLHAVMDLQDVQASFQAL